jgi:RNA-directed DNA polymerase
MRGAIRELDLRSLTHVSMAKVAEQLNPLLRGWIGYYGRFTPSALAPLYGHVDQTL